MESVTWVHHETDLIMSSKLGTKTDAWSLPPPDIKGSCRTAHQSLDLSLYKDFGIEYYYHNPDKSDTKQNQLLWEANNIDGLSLSQLCTLSATSDFNWVNGEYVEKDCAGNS
jgi:hypothetical protein